MSRFEIELVSKDSYSVIGEAIDEGTGPRCSRATRPADGGELRAIAGIDGQLEKIILKKSTRQKWTLPPRNQPAGNVAARAELEITGS
jgi:hypothetical protein